MESDTLFQLQPSNLRMTSQKKMAVGMTSVKATGAQLK